MSGRGNLVVLVLLLLALAFGLLLSLLPSRETDLPRSVFDDGPRGRSVALALFDELGLRARPWTEAPGRLPFGDGLLIVDGVPEPPPLYQDDVPEARRLRDPRHYLRFVEEGGTLLCSASPELLELAVEAFELTELAGVSSSPFDTDEALVVLDSGERLELDRAVPERLSVPSPPTRTETLLADPAGRPVALRLPVGRGALVLVAGGLGFLDNGRIQEADDALLAVRLVELCTRPGDPVLFDEYVLGGWTPDTPLDLALAPRNFPFTLHLVLLACLGLWASAWAREFPRDPAALTPVSAVVRARGLAGVLTRARRWGLLATMLRRGVLRRLAGRGARRLEELASHGVLDDLRAPRADTVHSVLDALAPHTDERERVRREELFCTAEVRGERDLEVLARELFELERRVHGSREDRPGTDRRVDDRWKSTKTRRSGTTSPAGTHPAR